MPEPKRPSGPTIAAIAFAVAAVLFILGAVMVDAVRGDDDLTAETGTTTTTADEEETETPGLPASGVDYPTPGLPAAYVVTRARDNPIISTNEYAEVMSLSLEPGKYQVFAKIGLSNRDPQLPFTAECALVPSDPDGTARGAQRAGESGSDYGDLHLGRSGEPGDRASISLVISQVLEVDGSVVLVCRGYGNPHGAFGSYGSVRAIRVGSIRTEEAPTP